MKNDYLPSTYESMFGELTTEEKEELIKADIPVPVVVGKTEISEEEKIAANKFLNKFRNK